MNSADVQAEPLPAATSADLPHLTFVPAALVSNKTLSKAPDTVAGGAHFFLWNDAAQGTLGRSIEALPLPVNAAPGEMALINADLKLRTVAGLRLPLKDTICALATTTVEELQRCSPSLTVWSLAAKLLLDLAVRERCVPRMQRTPAVAARWAAALALPNDAQRVALLAASFPLAAHAVPVDADKKAAVHVYSAEGLLRAFLDDGMD
jgi:hypothetical protein